MWIYSSVNCPVLKPLVIWPEILAEFVASYAEVKMFSHYFVSRFEYYELNLTDIQRQFISLDLFHKIFAVHIYRFCTALKTLQVHVKETVINTILVQSLTSIWFVNSSQAHCNYDDESHVSKLFLLKAIQKKMFNMIKFTFQLSIISYCKLIPFIYFETKSYFFHNHSEFK